MTAYTVLIGVSHSVPVTAIATPAAGVVPRPNLFVNDIYFGGSGRIGPYTVKVDSDPDDIPLHRRVRLYRDRDGIFIRETWSDEATGVYQFDGIDEREKYTVVAYDYEHDYRAVVADNLTPAVVG